MPSYELKRLEPTAEDVNYLEDRLYEHNAIRVGIDDGQIFAYLGRDEEGKIVAGITGWTWAQACEIQTLWVHPNLRGQGYGNRLLLAAEEEARKHGCQVILISSYTFQAPGFYQKHGYQLEWKLDDFPPGHAHCYLVKRLTEPRGDL